MLMSYLYMFNMSDFTSAFQWYVAGETVLQLTAMNKVVLRGGVLKFTLSDNQDPVEWLHVIADFISTVNEYPDYFIDKGIIEPIQYSSISVVFI